MGVMLKLVGALDSNRCDARYRVSHMSMAGTVDRNIPAKLDPYSPTGNAKLVTR